MLLIGGFFLTALLYASVGFGGGSTYNALLALAGIDFRLLPIVSLACNIVVVAGSTVQFARARVIPWRGAWTLALVAAPAAFVGGLTPIRQATFLLVLGLCLIGAGLAMLLPRRKGRDAVPHRYARFAPLAAAPLGYLAGLVGIGGGIFLAPLLHLWRWAGARQIAATTALFILINSVTGLAGQLVKSGPGAFAQALDRHWPLLIAVIVGGQVGTRLAVRLLPEQVIRWLTAALTIYAGSRLLATF